MEVKSIKEQWGEMQKLYKISGFKAVDICMKNYIKELRKSAPCFLCGKGV